MFDSIQQCPRCDGLIDRRHFLCRENHRDHTLETMLYCEHCDYGVESLWLRTDGSYELEFSLEYIGRTEPQSLARFIARLRARVAA